MILSDRPRPLPRCARPVPTKRRVLAFVRRAKVVPRFRLWEEFNVGEDARRLHETLRALVREKAVGFDSTRTMIFAR